MRVRPIDALHKIQYCLKIATCSIFIFGDMTYCTLLNASDGVGDMSKLHVLLNASLIEKYLIHLW
jgi:hypothetical protein